MRHASYLSIRGTKFNHFYVTALLRTSMAPFSLKRMRYKICTSYQSSIDFTLDGKITVFNEIYPGRLTVLIRLFWKFDKRTRPFDIWTFPKKRTLPTTMVSWGTVPFNKWDLFLLDFKQLIWMSSFGITFSCFKNICIHAIFAIFCQG